MGIKFVLVNYKQNNINYFESMIGETFNIRSKNMLYFQIFIMRHPIPYNSKKGVMKHQEVLSDVNINKYRLLYDHDLQKKGVLIYSLLNYILSQIIMENQQ